MKKLLLTLALVFASTTALNAECTKEQTALMIVNGVDQLGIDKACSTKQAKKVTTKASKKRSTKPRRYAVKRDRFYTSLGGSIYKLGVHYTDGTYEDSSDTLAISLKLALGYIFNNNDRVEIVFEKAGTDFQAYNFNMWGYSSLTANYIHTFGNKQVEVGSIRPFVLVGYSTYVFEEEEEGAGNTFNASGYSAGVGINYAYNNYVEFDLSFNYSYVTWDSTVVDWYSIPVNIALETFTYGPSIAMRYKF